MLRINKMKKMMEKLTKKTPPKFKLNLNAKLKINCTVRLHIHTDTRTQTCEGKKFK